MEDIVYLNGSLMPISQARLSPQDYGVAYGYGLFETMRAYSGHIFRLENHLGRLSRSAKFLGMELANTARLAEGLRATLEANSLSDARVRLTVSGGEGETLPDLVVSPSPTVLITARGYTPLSSQVYHQGFKAVVSCLRRNTQSPVSSMKSVSYLDSLLARREAKLAGADEAIMLNEQGFLAEGSTSNIFVVCGNTLMTPSEDSGILPGVTREVVLELAPAVGLKTMVRRLALPELSQADEAFFTNSVVEIMPLTRLGGERIGTGTAGKMTQLLIQAYRALVDEAVRG